MCSVLVGNANSIFSFLNAFIISRFTFCCVSMYSEKSLFFMKYTASNSMFESWNVFRCALDNSASSILFSIFSIIFGIFCSFSRGVSYCTPMFSPTLLFSMFLKFLTLVSVSSLFDTISSSPFSVLILVDFIPIFCTCPVSVPVDISSPLLNGLSKYIDIDANISDNTFCRAKANTMLATPSPANIVAKFTLKKASIVIIATIHAAIDRSFAYISITAGSFVSSSFMFSVIFL